MRLRLMRAGLAAMLVLSFTPALHAQPSGGDARSLAATCFTCHGTDGRSAGGVPPGLAGRNRAELLQQMKEFKEGKRPATIMHQHAKGYSDAQLELIATYFAGVPAGAAASPAKAGY